MKVTTFTGELPKRPQFGQGRAPKVIDPGIVKAVERLFDGKRLTVSFDDLDIDPKAEDDKGRNLLDKEIERQLTDFRRQALRVSDGKKTVSVFRIYNTDEDGNPTADSDPWRRVLTLADYTPREKRTGDSNGKDPEVSNAE